MRGARRLLTPCFLTPLRLEQAGWIDGRPEWRTLAALRYRSAILNGIVEIPADFDFDEASVPRLPLIWLIAGGRGRAESAIHDYGYQRGGLVVDGVFRCLSRAEVDAVFWEALAANPMSGTNTVTRWLMWAGVRVGGWAAWQYKAKRADILNPEWSETGNWPEPTETP